MMSKNDVVMFPRTSNKNLKYVGKSSCSNRITLLGWMLLPLEKNQGKILSCVSTSFRITLQIGREEYDKRTSHSRIHGRSCSWRMNDSVFPKYFSDPTISVCTIPSDLYNLSFPPSFSGLPQSGLASAIAQSISLLPEDLQGMFWAIIGLIGWTTKFPGFRERL